MKNPYLHSVFPRRYRVTVLMSLFFLLWLCAVKIFSFVVISKVDNNWQEIFTEKSAEHSDAVISDFIASQNDLNNFSEKLSGNLNIRKNLEKIDTRKIYDEVLSAEIPDIMSIEIYDKRFEQICFEGRQLNPEFILLQKAFKGITFTVLKDIGFYTYLIYYSPIKELSDENSYSGVLVSGVVIGSKYSGTSNNNTEDLLGNKLRNRLNTEVDFYPADTYSGLIRTDTISDRQYVKLAGIGGLIIGKAGIQKYELRYHNDYIQKLSSRIAAVLIFLFTLFLLPSVFRLVNLFRSILVRIILTFIVLIFIRYLWIVTGFPTDLFESEIFMPQYFASKFGAGIARSLGDLMVTSLFLLFFAVYTVSAVHSVVINPKPVTEKRNILVSAFLFLFFTGCVFLLFNVYGETVKSLIFDSNIKFLDKTDIIPDLPLFVIQISILVFTFTYLILNTVFILLVIDHARVFSAKKNYRKVYIFAVFLLFLVINEAFNYSGINFTIINLHRILIICLIFLFCFYILKSSIARKNYFLFSLRNISFIVLISIIVTPLILLEKTKSQETSYIELIGSELTENQDEKVIYLISNELTKLSKDRNAEDFIKDGSKTQLLSYYFWRNSKLNDLNYKSDIIVLDSSKKIISDFNASAGLINADSVVSFVKKNFFSKKLNVSVPDEGLKSDTAFFDDYETDIEKPGSTEINIEPIKFDDISILKNKQFNYYTGIVPVENMDLRNTQFAEIVGYILVSVNSESINLFSGERFNSYGNSPKETLLDKLITKPVISEFINGEVTNSTEPEISKNILRYLENYRNQIRSGEKSNYWRYDIVNNERYRTYFSGSGRTFFENQVGESSENGSNSEEKIFAVSLRRDDFSLLTFYFLKFILFSLIVYAVFYVFYSIPYLFRIKTIRLNFTEKLFLSFLVVSVIPIVLLAVYTRTYINSKNELSIRNQLISDLNLVNEALKDEKTIFNKFKPLDTIKSVAKDVLVRNFFNSGKNYNLFIRNKMVASTNEELFRSDFLDTRLDADGYYNINVLKKDLYIKNQSIDGISYLVGYKPLKDRGNFVNGVISSLSVYRQKEMNEELTETLTFIFGSYFIVAMILLVIVSFITGKISKPILIMKAATEKLARGESKVEIKIKRNDEIGSLVDSFNKMARDLERTKEEVKKAEREAAWRDIARRVAHEIKNPLTPIKLSIQHLYNIHKENDPENFEKVLKKTKDLISSEIDKLSKIATAFSDFAKLPGRNYQPLNLNEILEDVISLYSLDPKVEFRKNLFENLRSVFGDKQEMNRVFQNLIKNSVQSIEKNGLISVSSRNESDKVVIEISDNGCGIEPEILNKLFEPNFSTKSQGMGLGLAITRKSLDDMKAAITYRSKLHEGTTVTLYFRIYIERLHS